MKARALALALAALVTGARPAEPTETIQLALTAMPAVGDGRVVLVTVDGVRWQDVFEGSDPSLGGGAHVPPEQLLPRTYALLPTRGLALGADLPGCATVHTTSGVNVSLPGYLEIFTGHASYCMDNSCDRVAASVMDQAVRAQVQGVASIGSWQVLDRAVSNGQTGVLVAEGRTWPASEPVEGMPLALSVTLGAAADPFPGTGAFRPDHWTAAIAHDYYVAEKPAFFHVGLGDTDEYGHRNDYASYLDALRRADAVVGDLVDAVDGAGLADKTTILVTPDHGRAANFKDHGALFVESGRTFLVAIGPHLAAHGIGCPTHDIELRDLAPTIRVLLGMSPDRTEGVGTAIALFTSG